MAKGTGLPFPGNDVLAQPTQGINADALSNAASWRQIADAGSRLTNIGVDAIERETHSANVGYLADQETEIARKRIELRDQFATDPTGFDKAWTAYTDGKLSESEAWAVPHLKRRLGQEGNGAYGSLLAEKRSTDRALDGSRVRTLAKQSADDVIGSAMTGTLGTTDGQAKLAKLTAVYDTAVSSGFMTREEADIHLADVTSRAGAESVVKAIGDTYRDNRARGLDAGTLALREAEKTLLRTDDKRLQGLSEEQRYGYYHKATAEIRALEAERKRDLQLAKQAKSDAEAAISRGVRVSPDVVDDIVKQLNSAGGHAEAARLRATVARQEFLGPYGRLPLRQQVAQFRSMTAATGAGFSPEVNSALATASQESGVPLDMLRRYTQIESGGKPGQITGSYKGLFQLSDAEFARYGRGDILNPVDNARAAARKFAAEREAFKAQFNRDATMTDLYMVHQQGAGGYAAHLSNPQGLAWENMASTAEGRAKGAEWAKKAIWGNLPDAAKRRFGSVENVTSGDFVNFWAQRLGSQGALEFGPGVDLRLATGMQREIGTGAKELWTKVKGAYDRQEQPDPKELETLIQAATISGDHNLLEEIGARAARFESVQANVRRPLAAQASDIERTRTSGPMTAGQSAWLRDMETSLKSTREKLTNDPITLGAERFPERIKQPDPFNLNDREAALQGMKQRAGIARFVGENYGKTDIPVLSAADRTQIAGAIAGADPKQASIALDVLATVPDANFSATLGSSEIKTALSAAVRSTDPQKFSSAMMTVDRMWARAPQEVAKTFGDDVIKQLQDWQAKLRYHTPEQLAESLKRADDPQVRAQRAALEKEARAIVHKSRDGIQLRSINTLLNDLDPGIFVRAAKAPLDAWTRDAAMADYESLFVERYAETRDQSLAHKQAIERMKLYWSRSDVNGGKLTLHAPESAYPAVNGSHDWMRKQLLDDLKGQLGYLPDAWSVVTDRNTEAERTQNKPPSYTVVYRNKKGEVEVMRGPDNRPLRYKWNVEGDADSARDAFARQRARIFDARENGDFSDISPLDLSP